jgi:transposase InsO family protein
MRDEVGQGSDGLQSVWHDPAMRTGITALLALTCDALRWLRLTVKSSRSIKAENLFLRRQLALYMERGVKLRRVDPVARLRLVLLSRRFDWRSALVVVRPETLLRWHRSAWKLLWRLKSRPGRPAIPVELQLIIRRMALENPRWGEERIANEFLLKLCIQVSPRTVRKYMPRHPPGRPRGDLRWSAFLRLHAQGILACDFCLTLTASFRMLYVFVVIEHASRRLVHCNVTAHTTAAWTLQQLREVVGLDHRYQFLLHDRDCIFSHELDQSFQALGIRVLRSAPHCPKMNAVCERVIGTLRRERLDWLVPLSESHLRALLRAWTRHYNRGRPHMALGPGIPDPPLTAIPHSPSRHRRGGSYAVQAEPILGGLHHEYHLVAA